MTDKWDPTSPIYKRARSRAKIWDWAGAAEIMDVTVEYLLSRWEEDKECRCPVSGRTYQQTMTLIQELNAEAEALCR